MCFVGGTLFTSSVEGLFRSEDNGITWKKVDGGLPNSAVGYLHNFEGKMFASLTIGGVWMSQDSGKTWEQCLNNNFSLFGTAKQGIVQFGHDTLFAALIKNIPPDGKKSEIWFSDQGGIPNSWSFAWSIPYTSVQANRDLAVVDNSIFVFTNKANVYECLPRTGIDKWNALEQVPTKELNFCLTYDATTVLLTTVGSGILSSSDKCRTWNSVVAGLELLPTMETSPLVSNGKDLFVALHSSRGEYLGIYWREKNEGRWKSIGAINIPLRTLREEGTSYISSMIATKTHLIIGTSGDGVLTYKMKDIIP